MNSKQDFRKKIRFRRLNSKLKHILEKHIAKHKKHWKLLRLYLDFHSYFEATGSNCFNVFWNILLQSIFLARIISWLPKRMQKLWKPKSAPSQTEWRQLELSCDKLANFGYQTDRKEDFLWPKQNQSRLTIASRCWHQLGCHRDFVARQLNKA